MTNTLRELVNKVNKRLTKRRIDISDYITIAMDEFCPLLRKEIQTLELPYYTKEYSDAISNVETLLGKGKQFIDVMTASIECRALTTTQCNAVTDIFFMLYGLAQSAEPYFHEENERHEGSGRAETQKLINPYQGDINSIYEGLPTDFLVMLKNSCETKDDTENATILTQYLAKRHPGVEFPSYKSRAKQMAEITAALTGLGSPETAK